MKKPKGYGEDPQARLRERDDFTSRLFDRISPPRGTRFPTSEGDPSAGTADEGEFPPGAEPWNPKRAPVSLKKGGPIKKVSGKPIGKEDGLIAVQKGEFVIRKSSVAKYGSKKMGAVNRGTAKVTPGKKR